MNIQDFKFKQAKDKSGVIFHVSHGDLRFKMQIDPDTHEFKVAHSDKVPQEILDLEDKLSEKIYGKDM